MLTAPADGTHSLYHLEFFVPDGQVCYNMVDQDRKRMTGECTKKGERESIYTGLVGGTSAYFVMGTNRNARSRPYAITVTRTPLPGDNFSTIETASKLDVGQQRTAVLAALVNRRERPNHMYKVKLKQPGEYEVVVDPGDSDVNPRVEILNKDRRRIAGGSGGNRGAVARVRVRVISKQKIFVDVSSLHSLRRAEKEHPARHQREPYKISVLRVGP